MGFRVSGFRVWEFGFQGFRISGFGGYVLAASFSLALPQSDSGRLFRV